MATITTQDIQDIAVKCASEFFNNNTPLNESLAKEASCRGLNSDQLKRAVEATNTVTYLKSIEVAKDRTSEFALGDYREIVKQASLPEIKTVTEDFSDGDLQKTASIQDPLETPKTVEVSELTCTNEFIKQASINRRKWEDAKTQLEYNNENFIKIARLLGQSQEFVRILSGTSATDSEFVKIAKYATGQVQERQVSVKGMFKSAQLQEVEGLVDMFRQSVQLTKTIKECEDFEKQAWLMPVLGNLGKSTKNFLSPKLGSGAENVGKALGRGLTKSVTGPASVVANTLAKPFRGVGKAVGTKLNNAIADTHLGRQIGMKVKPVNPNVKRNLAMAATVGGATLDAVTYSPGKDISKGQMGSVWETLQG